MTNTRRYAPPPSPKAANFLLQLASERRLPELGTCAEERMENVGAMLDNGLDAYATSRLIDRLKAAPLDLDEVEVEPGVYRRDDTIYVVRQNRTNAGVHARRLVEIGGQRLTAAGTVVNIEFVYDPGALLRLRPEDQMTLEEARPFIIRYGKCIFCNTALSDATSVARGVGPVCVRRYAPPVPVPTVKAEVRTELGALLAGLGA